MQTLWSLFTVLAGPFVGSFLGLASLRLPAGRSFVRGRSACLACAKPLGPHELIPLLGYLLQRGRCRACAAAIPPRYPLLETTCMIIGLLSALLASGPLALATAVLGWWLLLIAVIDAEHMLLPDSLTLPLIVAGLAVGAWRTPGLDHIIGAAAGFAALSLVALVYRRLRGLDGLGDGDPRLFAASGAWLGWTALPTVLLGATLLALGYVLVRQARGHRLGAQDALPFGPFLAAATWGVWLWGL